MVVYVLVHQIIYVSHEDSHLNEKYCLNIRYFYLKEENSSDILRNDDESWIIISIYIVS